MVDSITITIVILNVAKVLDDKNFNVRSFPSLYQFILDISWTSFKLDNDAWQIVRQIQEDALGSKLIRKRRV